MNKLLFIFLAIAIIFSACKKEEELATTNNPIFVEEFNCMVDGASLSSTEITISNLSDNLSIVAVNENTSVSLNLPSISSRYSGSTIVFSSPGLGFITIGSDTYANTYFDASKGEIEITSINSSSSKISGTFFFESMHVDPTNFDKVNITSGSFSNISF